MWHIVTTVKQIYDFSLCFEVFVQPPMFVIALFFHFLELYAIPNPEVIWRTLEKLRNIFLSFKSTMEKIP